MTTADDMAPPPSTWEVRALALLAGLVLPGQLTLLLVFNGATLDKGQRALLGLVSLQGMCVLCVLGVIWVWGTPGQRLRQLGLTEFTPKVLAGSVGMSLVIIPTAIGLAILTILGAGALGLDWRPNDQILKTMRETSPLTRGLLVLGAVVLAPLGEELAFRRVLFRNVERWLGPVMATLLVSALFAALHLNPVAFVVLLAFGVALQTIMIFTENLCYPILIHAVYNGAMVSLTLLPQALSG